MDKSNLQNNLNASDSYAIPNSGNLLSNPISADTAKVKKPSKRLIKNVFRLDTNILKDLGVKSKIFDAVSKISYKKKIVTSSESSACEKAVPLIVEGVNVKKESQLSNDFLTQKVDTLESPVPVQTTNSETFLSIHSNSLMGFPSNFTSEKINENKEKEVISPVQVPTTSLNQIEFPLILPEEVNNEIPIHPIEQIKQEENVFSSQIQIPTTSKCAIYPTMGSPLNSVADEILVKNEKPRNDSVPNTNTSSINRDLNKKVEILSNVKLNHPKEKIQIEKLISPHFEPRNIINFIRGINVKRDEYKNFKNKSNETNESGSKEKQKNNSSEDLCIKQDTKSSEPTILYAPPNVQIDLRAFLKARAAKKLNEKKEFDGINLNANSDEQCVEKITKLADESLEYSNDSMFYGFETNSTNHEQIIKFIDLIVKECHLIWDKYQLNEVHKKLEILIYEELKNQIKSHDKAASECTLQATENLAKESDEIPPIKQILLKSRRVKALPAPVLRKHILKSTKIPQKTVEVGSLNCPSDIQSEKSKTKIAAENSTDELKVLNEIEVKELNLSENISQKSDIEMELLENLSNSNLLNANTDNHSDSILIEKPLNDSLSQNISTKIAHEENSKSKIDAKEMAKKLIKLCRKKAKQEIQTDTVNVHIDQPELDFSIGEIPNIINSDKTNSLPDSCVQVIAVEFPHQSIVGDIEHGTDLSTVDILNIPDTDIIYAEDVTTENSFINNELLVNSTFLLPSNPIQTINYPFHGDSEDPNEQIYKRDDETVETESSLNFDENVSEIDQISKEPIMNQNIPYFYKEGIPSSGQISDAKIGQMVNVTPAIDERSVSVFQNDSLKFENLKSNELTPISSKNILIENSENPPIDDVLGQISQSKVKDLEIIKDKNVSTDSQLNKNNFPNKCDELELPANPQPNILLVNEDIVPNTTTNFNNSTEKESTLVEDQVMEDNSNKTNNINLVDEDVSSSLSDSKKHLKISTDDVHKEEPMPSVSFMSKKPVIDDEFYCNLQDSPASHSPHSDSSIFDYIHRSYIYKNRLKNTLPLDIGKVESELSESSEDSSTNESAFNHQSEHNIKESTNNSLISRLASRIDKETLISDFLDCEKKKYFKSTNSDVSEDSASDISEIILDNIDGNFTNTIADNVDEDITDNIDENVVDNENTAINVDDSVSETVKIDDKIVDNIANDTALNVAQNIVNNISKSTADGANAVDSVAENITENTGNRIDTDDSVAESIVNNIAEKTTEKHDTCDNATDDAIYNIAKEKTDRIEIDNSVAERVNIDDKDTTNNIVDTISHTITVDINDKISNKSPDNIATDIVDTVTNENETNNQYVDSIDDDESDFLGYDLNHTINGNEWQNRSLRDYSKENESKILKWLNDIDNYIGCKKLNEINKNNETESLCIEFDSEDHQKEHSKSIRKNSEKSNVCMKNDQLNLPISDLIQVNNTRKRQIPNDDNGNVKRQRISEKSTIKKRTKTNHGPKMNQVRRQIKKELIVNTIEEPTNVNNTSNDFLTITESNVDTTNLTEEITNPNVENNSNINNRQNIKSEPTLDIFSETEDEPLSTLIKPHAKRRGRPSKTIDKKSKRQRKNDDNIDKSIKQIPAIVKCGNCLIEVDKSNWNDHLKEHYGLAWIDGLEKPVDMTNLNAKTSHMIRYAKIANIKMYTCHKCGDVKKSAMGYISHTEICGLSIEERKQKLVKCKYCPAMLRAVSVQIHEQQSCIVLKERREDAIKEQKKNLEIQDDNDNDNDDDSNTERPRRKSAKRAIKSFRQSMDPGRYHRTMADIEKLIVQYKDIAEVITNGWDEQLQKTGHILCDRTDCSFETWSVSDMCKHHKKCKLDTENAKFICQICKYGPFNRDTIRQHILQTHSKLEDIDRAHSHQDSEWNNGGDDESSDDGSSGVDEQEIWRKQDGEKNEYTSDSDNGDVQKKKKQISSVRKSNVPQLELTSDKKVVVDYVDDLKHQGKMLHRKTMEWTEKFYKKNFSTDPLFPHLTIKDFHVIKSQAADAFRPSKNISNKFTCQYTTSDVFKPMPINNESWQCLKLYESQIMNEFYIMFCGGAITVAEWIPLPSSYEKSQMIAVCCKNKAFKLYTNTAVEPVKCSIQIWNIDNLTNALANNFNAKTKPNVLYSIGLDYGPILHMKFCPSGGFSNDRLALLAVPYVNGNLAILSLPKNVNCDNENGDILLSINPSLVLSCNSCKSENVFVTRIEWSKELGHSIVVAGYNNGMIVIWNLFNVSSSLLYQKLSNDSEGILQPHQVFYAFSSVICQLDLHVDCLNNGRWLAVGGFDRKIKCYDLQNSEPIEISLTLYKSRITSGCWPLNWTIIFSGVDDVYALGSGIMLRQPLDIGSRSFAIFQSAGHTCDISFNDWLNLFIFVNDYGSIYTAYPSQLIGSFVDSAKKIRAVVGFTDVVSTESESSDLKKVKTGKPAKGKNHNAKSNVQLYSDKSGIVFYDHREPLQSGKAPNDDDRRLTMYQSDVNLNKINKIVFNPNANAYKSYALGYECGLLRIMFVKPVKK